MDPAWFAILVTVILAVIAGLVAHIRDDAKTKERLAKVEVQVGQDHEEIKNLRDRWHDLREGAIKDIWNALHDKFEALKLEVLRLTRREKD